MWWASGRRIGIGRVRADTDNVQKLLVSHLTKDGQDRLYVATAGGYEVGYLDRRTSERVLEDDAWHAAFDKAIAAFTPGQTGPATIAAWPPIGFGWTDLSLNEPGNGAGDKGKARQQAAPASTFVARVLGVHTDERTWRLGNNGEAAVAKRLARLGPAWRTLHAIPMGSGSTVIDHLVIGPGGIFSVNTKNHPNATVWVGGNTVIVNGNQVSHVRNCRHDAQRAARILSSTLGAHVPVTGLVAVLGAQRGFTVREQPRDGRVVVLRRRNLDTWLSHRPTALSTDAMAEVFEIARRSTTWT
jgi:hypothetical protein